ncbi:MAG: nucleotidyltransferase domain-containing protein [Candidatus Yanofskybacteria bacterium]|nr:nucleotidyltransferase domain-containing protein [Candidatus Yanofskybacteria bacterium]
MEFNLRHNILATLAYYDIFDFPLKAEEIFARLINFKHIITGYRLPVTDYRTLQKELDLLILDRTINRSGNYYFLFGREYLIPLRLKRGEIAKRKWRIAKRAIRWLRFVPYLRAVFASGSLAMNNTDELSDLDVLVVVKHGRIWLARLLITAMLSVLHFRRRGRDKIAPDKICLNHYISDEAMLIPHQSIYNAQTYANLVPILASEMITKNFQKTNVWVLDYVNNWNMGLVETGLNLGVSARILEPFLEISDLDYFLNKISGRYQSRRITDNPVTHQTGGRVIFTDEQLEFHPRSMETQIIKSFNARLIKIGLPQLAVEKDSGLT